MNADVGRVLENALTAACRRHAAISQNLANVDTPGFKRRDVAFFAELRACLKESCESLKVDLVRTHSLHIGRRLERPEDVLPRDVRETAVSQRADGNSVDLDREVAELVRNSAHYEALVSVLSRRIGLLRTAIR